MKNFKEGRINRDQVFDMRSAWRHVAKIAEAVGIKANFGEATEDSFTGDFHSGDDRLLNHGPISRIYNTTVTFTFKDSGYIIDDEHADYDRFQGDFSKGWTEFDQDVRDLLTDMINNFSKKEMREAVIPVDQEEILREVVAEAYPEYVGIIDDYLKNGLEDCESCFDDDNALIDDFITYAEYILEK